MTKFTEIGSRISSMADHSEISMSIIDITNSTRICSKRDHVADSAEIGSKDVHMTIHMREGPSSVTRGRLPLRGPQDRSRRELSLVKGRRAV